MNKRLEKGITLIALIITIIILLILAGITIATLGGENGLLAKVKKAKEAEIKAEMREELTLALHDLQIEKRAEATLDDVTQDWINEQIKKYECTVNDDASLSGKQVIMKKDKIRGKFLIDGNLNIIEEEYNESSIEFSYETREREGNKINIAIIIKDEINGIKEVQMPDGTIYPYNKKEQVGIDYSVELGVEYKVKITSESGEVVEKTIKIDDYYYKVTKTLDEGIKIDNTAIKAAWNKPYQATITAEENYIMDTITVTMGGQAVTVDKTTGVINIDKVTDDIEITATAKKLEIKYTVIAVNTSSSATTSLRANTQPAGTTLYINIVANLEGTNCTITNKDDNKPIPYTVTKNGKYTFIVTGTYNEKTITEEKEVLVNQYISAQGVVDYHAGNWTKEEIEELQNQNLYMINKEKTYNSTFNLNDKNNGLNFTFGGFTYNGDTANKDNIDSGNIITSKDESVSTQYGKPKYSGWQILESKEENGKTYVTKIVHAGTPENFVYSYSNIGDAYRTEYILSGGTKQTGYSTLGDGKTAINPRSWQMYIDQDQKDLIKNTEKTDENGNPIKDIHAMDYDEVRISNTNGMKNTGDYYWIASASYDSSLWYVDNGGNIYDAHSFNVYNRCFGIRPVVTMADGVYISSGTGIDADPYILAKD